MTAKEWLDFIGQQGLAIALVVAGVIAIYRHIPIVLTQHRKGMEDISAGLGRVTDATHAVTQEVIGARREIGDLPDRIAARIKP